MASRLQDILESAYYGQLTGHLGFTRIVLSAIMDFHVHVRDYGFISEKEIYIVSKNLFLYFIMLSRGTTFFLLMSIVVTEPQYFLFFLVF